MVQGVESSGATEAAVQPAKVALLDAAERLLIEVGYAGVTTRRVAEEAGVNHGLVHYYFGSMEELFSQVLERFVGRFVDLLRALYEDPNLTFLEKWRAGAEFLQQDPIADFPKILLELLAMSWNNPALRSRTAAVHDEFREVIREPFTLAMREYGIDEKRFPLDAVIALVISSQLGQMVEQLSGVRTGQAELAAMIDRWLESVDRAAQSSGRSER
jgi:AcrR family transcriptional regulator